MESYIALKPKDADGFRELAALYLQQASTAQERAQIYQVRSDYLAPGSIRDTIFQLGGSPLAPDPDHERREHVLRRGDLGGGVGDPVRLRAGGRAVQAHHGAAAG